MLNKPSQTTGPQVAVIGSHDRIDRRNNRQTYQLTGLTRFCFISTDLHMNFQSYKADINKLFFFFLLDKLLKPGWFMGSHVKDSRSGKTIGGFFNVFVFESLCWIDAFCCLLSHKSNCLVVDWSFLRLSTWLLLCLNWKSWLGCGAWSHLKAFAWLFFVLLHEAHFLTLRHQILLENKQDETQEFDHQTREAESKVG